VTDAGEFPCAGRPFFIEGPVGRIETLASCPAREAVRASAVILHPHPLHGGTMHNKVVSTLARAFHELGLHTLRFNFRGTGSSEGSFDHGEGESADLMAVLAWLRARRPQDELWLAGFSFGGYIALRSAEAAGAARLITVAPSVNLDAAPQAPRMPWLLIQGEQDEVVPYAKVREWLNGLSRRPDLLLLPDAGHFFHGRLLELRAHIQARLGAHVPRA
jgi:alpha/beta superfamily hydrolase